MKTVFFGEQKLKDAVLDQLREHRRLDQIAQGVYWNEGKGCHLGCLTHDNVSSHESAERLFGIPLRIGYWLEAVFEGLPKEDCAWWVVASIEAIPSGADMSLAHYKLAYWMLGPDSPSAAGNSHPLVSEAVASVRELHRRAADGCGWNESAAASARSAAAWSAAGSAAASARSAAARSAAWSARSAAESARSAAESAAESARSAAESARSAAASAAESAWSAAWKAIADKSIEIFAACPVVECEECTDCAAAAENHMKSISLSRRTNGLFM